MEGPDKKIIPFPTSYDPQAVQGADSTIRVGDFVAPDAKVVSITEETGVFEQQWKDHARQLISEAHLPEVPENIHGIKNGTILRSQRFVEDVGINNKEDVVVYYDGTYINIGGVQSPYKITLEGLIEEINKSYWEVVGSV